MQKIRFFIVFLVVWMTGFVKAQINFDCNSTAAPQVNTGCFDEFFTQKEIDALPIATIRINIHYIGHAVFGNFYPGDANDWSQSNGNKYAELMIAHANERWADLKPSTTSLDDFLGDSKIRFEIYSEPSNTSDLHKGIWYYSNLAEFQAVASNLPYSGKVIHVLMIAANTPANPVQGGAISWLVPGERSIQLNDPFFNASSEVWGWWAYARMLMHEVGHMGGLDHAYYCGNICNDIDIDANVECNLPSGGCSNSPGGSACNGWASGGTNMMSNNMELHSLSPCQWNQMMKNLYVQNYSWVRFCSPPIAPYVIESGTNEVWDKFKVMNRDVIIEPLASLIINCEVRFGDMKMVHVKRGARLTLNSGGKMTKLCVEKKWRGIVVNGNNNIGHGQVNVTGALVADNPGIVLLNGGEISYAGTGISCNPPVLWPDLAQNWNGIIQANGTIFLNNNRGVEFMLDSKTTINPDGSFSVVLPLNTNKSSFSGCSFLDNYAEITNSRGVSIWAANSILFNQCTFSAMDQYGIQTYDAALTVKASTFSNNDFGVLATTTSNSLFAPIVIGGSTDNKNFFIKNNYGVYASTISDLRVSYNDFSGSNRIGVYVLGASAYNIHDNTFFNCKGGIVNKQTGRDLKRAECNVYDFLQTGITNQGNNQGFYFLNEEFKPNNNFNVFVTDILDLAQNMTEQGVMRNQGSVGNAVFNKFSSPDYERAILTNGDVLKFNYYYPNPITYPRAEPGCTLNAPCVNTTNNYDKFQESGVASACLPFPHPPFEDDRAKIEIVYGRIKAISELPMGNIDIALRTELDSLERIKGEIMSRLVNADVVNANYTGLEELFTMVEDYRQLFGLKIFQSQWVEAANLLEVMPALDEADKQYKEVQAINLRRLKSTSLFELTQSDHELLRAIGNANTNASPYAQSLLMLLKGELVRPYIPFPDEMEERNSTLKAVHPVPFVISPNPTKDILRISLSEGLQGALLDIQILDITGRVVLQYKQKFSNEVVLPLSHLSEGLYLLSIKNERGIVGTAKFFHQP
jgi:Secretion system C-terminal sorting domain/Right handed beta helix region